ncbi:MAG: molybdopterin-dependent oxidoreductase, partial [Gammaproteobacteria bacterium]|nr:molybdopterin-dependent oxidoreductase [Gammaproteobacteria bacterium]
TRAAEQLPGVKAVLTPADCPKRKYTTVYFVPTDAASMVRDMLVMSDTVRYAGQPVAAVAATSVAVAEQALDLIEVEYEELPFVLDPEQSMQPGAPQLHEHAENNVAVNPIMEFGDLDAGFAEADHIFEDVYETQRVHTCYMEPRVCVVDAEQNGDLTVHSSMQHLFGLREKLAYILEIPQSQVRVMKPPYIGGGFGGKLDIGYIEPIAALLSMQTNRPVRIEQTRYEDFITTARHPIKVYLKTGVKKDGTFTARYAKSILDTGAHATHGAEVINVHGMFGFLLTYRCENRKWEGYSVYTNNMVGGGYRGYGSPQACFAVESQIDEICDALDLDPIEFRRKNAHHQGDPHPFVQGMNLDTYAFDECLLRGAEQIGFAQRARPNAGKGHKKRGVGFACQPLWVSGCLGFPDIYEHSGAIVKLNPDGTADLSTAAMDLGSGQITTLCQIAAEELGLPMEAVRITQTADTTTVPFDAPSHASRVTYGSGTAVLAAARVARQRMLQVAGIMLEVGEEDLEVNDGKISVKGSPDRSITVAAVAERAESPFIQVGEAGPAPTTVEEKGTIIGLSSTAPAGNPSPASVGFVEVEVDTETGAVQVERVVYAHDLGRVINPHGAEGQVEGGFQQGIGYALMENLQFEENSGACLTADFLDYKMPTAVEMPRKIESIFIESNEPTGPFGAKSLSEPCITVPAPAIANAIYNAIGVRIRELPITPEKILAGLGKL